MLVFSNIHFAEMYEDKIAEVGCLEKQCDHEYKREILPNFIRANNFNMLIKLGTNYSYKVHIDKIYI